MLETSKQASLYIVPILATAWAVLRAGRAAGITKSIVMRFAALVLSVPLALVKLGPLSIAGLVLTVSPGYSIITMFLLAVLVLSELDSAPVILSRDWGTIWAGNIVLGGYLYLSVLGLAPYDAYPLGDTFSWVFVAAAIYTLALIVMKNPMACAYVLAIAGYTLMVLSHSRNFFDYLIDGPLFVASIAGAVVLLVRTIRLRTA